MINDLFEFGVPVELLFDVDDLIMAKDIPKVEPHILILSHTPTHTRYTHTYTHNKTPKHYTNIHTHTLTYTTHTHSCMYIRTYTNTH